MSVRIEKSGSVWTVIHSRPEARNAMDPKSADALVAAFEAVRCRRSRQRRGVLGRGRRLLRGLGSQERVGPRPGQSRRPPRLPQGRRQGAARSARPLAPGDVEARDRRRRGPGGGRRHGAGDVVRRARHGRERLLRRLLPALGRSADRRRHGAPAAPGRPGQGAGDHHDGPQGDGRGVLPHRPVREGRPARQGARGGRGHGAGDRPLPAGVHALRPPLGLSRLGQVGARGPGERVGDERRHRQGRGHRRCRRASPPARAATATSRTSERPRCCFWRRRRRKSGYPGLRLLRWWAPAACLPASWWHCSSSRSRSSAVPAGRRLAPSSSSQSAHGPRDVLCHVRHRPRDRSALEDAERVCDECSAA